MNVIDYIAKEAADQVARDKQAWAGAALRGLGAATRGLGRGAKATSNWQYANPWKTGLGSGAAVAGSSFLPGETGSDVQDVVQGLTSLNPVGLAVNSVLDFIPGVGESDNENWQKGLGGFDTSKGAWGGVGRPLLHAVSHPAASLWNIGRSLIPGTGNSMWGHKPLGAPPQPPIRQPERIMGGRQQQRQPIDEYYNKVGAPGPVKPPVGVKPLAGVPASGPSQPPGLHPPGANGAAL